ncbi:MAG: aldo/keto reductase [Rhodocyclaceae bacterium]|nr:aldo/keto reductase [Rhodocyclaceae bacterium]
MKRRTFLKKSLFAGGAAMLGARALFANPTETTNMQNAVPDYVLNNGVHIPILGYGTWNVRGRDGQQAIEAALEVGYRHIDSAAYYRNEDIVGAAVRASGLRREEVFVTTKLMWGMDADGEAAKREFAKSLKALQMDYVDLYLIHAPYGDIKSIWAAFCALHEQGRAKAIGVSNFSTELVAQLCEEFPVKPALNQIELHPFHQQVQTQAALDKLGVATESYSPFGTGDTRILKNETLTRIGEKYGKTAAQVILRWQIQRNIITIPKTARRARMIENLSIFDFALSDEDMQQIAALG